MLQRIRGAIDARIAEEQARQRSGQEPISRSSSNARRPARPRRDDSFSGKGPDPAEFDAEFVVGEDDGSSGMNTPSRDADGGNDEKGPAGQDGRDRSIAASDAATLGNGTITPSDLPTEVRVKLRRLDKLEGRYQELLKAYRVAHSRVLSVEPFEAALRENTPLTSISDPRAMTEYLNQLALKGDMVVDELKRVSAGRDDFKSKLEAAEKSTREAWDEVANLKKKKPEGDDESQDAAGQANTTSLTVDTQTAATEEAADSALKSPAPSTTSRAASIRGLFSPKAKAVKSPSPMPESEEFFSFENEIPRMESELKEREEEVSELNSRIKTLTGDLAVARESTEGMAQSLESATRELHGLREGKERHETELKNQRTSFQEQIASLESKLASASSELEDSTANMESIRLQLKDKEQELKESKESLLSRERQIEATGAASGKKKGAGKGKTGGENKRLEILQGVVENLKAQLKDAESTVASLKAELASNEGETKSLQQIVEFVDNGLEGNQTWNAAKEKLSKNENASFEDIRQSLIPASASGMAGEEPTEAPKQAPSQVTNNNTGGGGGKKKNKKKKKGGKQDVHEAPKATAVTAEPTVSLSESGNEAIRGLEEKIAKLESELSDKDAAIERIHLKLKGEEGLREEIESLRDDLLNVGQEHVESKEKAKELLTEKTALEERIKGLEKELLELRTSSAETTLGSEKAHKDLTAEFEDLRIKSAALETDLSVAQQLATSRFKDLTDLKEAIQKIQPELRTLRAESAELKTAKEELVTKTSQLSTLERKHDDLRTEVKTLRSTLGDKESDIKMLNQKISQETNSRIKTEQALEVAQSDLRYSEGQRQDVIENNERTLKELSKTQEEHRNTRLKLRDVEDQVAQLNRDIERLRDEIQLKTAQHASAQSLMGNMRDQASEMAMQVKEATERCENLEEEVADAHRLLSERTREGETMRRLLADVETRADIKVRETKERLEAAIEERDRAEEETNTAGRRRAREMEELKTKAREAERALRRAEEDKEELEHTQKDWKRRRSELEARAEQATKELEDTKLAMSQLRDSLDESEKQARDLQKEKSELRRAVEETNQRLDKLRRSNKTVSDELKSLQPNKRRGIESANRSARSSIDSRRGVVSPSPGTRNGSIETPSGPTAPSIDYVYLKNVLLQFLEQKDKNYQKQLIPVLGMLLHFDSKDEQRWMSAVTSR